MRILSPDSLVVCQLSDAGETRQITPLDAIAVIANAAAVPFSGSSPTEAESLPARKIAQQVLKQCAINRDNFARGAAGITLLCAVRLGKAAGSA
jgi:hypothetical protein